MGSDVGAGRAGGSWSVRTLTVVRFQVVPAAYVLLRRGDEVLLALRQNTGYRDGHWACAAAGHVENGESVFAAACREAKEELGVTIDAADLVAVTTLHRTHGNGQPVDERVDFFFSTTRWTGQPRVCEPTRSGGLQWAALGALPDPVVPHERFVLDGMATGSLPAIAAFGF